MGVNVEGAGSDLIRAIAGEKGAEVILGTTNSTVATIGNAKAMLGAMKPEIVGKISATPSTPNGATTKMPPGITKW
jgi:hypothetical protein